MLLFSKVMKSQVYGQSLSVQGDKHPKAPAYLLFDLMCNLGTLTPRKRCFGWESSLRNIADEVKIGHLVDVRG